MTESKKQFQDHTICQDLLQWFFQDHAICHNLLKWLTVSGGQSFSHELISFSSTLIVNHVKIVVKVVPVDFLIKNSSRTTPFDNFCHNLLKWLNISAGQLLSLSHDPITFCPPLIVDHIRIMAKVVVHKSPQLPHLVPYLRTSQYPDVQMFKM